MKLIFTILTFVCFLGVSAQLNRYPYIQSTTQNSTIIAWKTANNVIGKVAYGLTASALTDTLTETAAGKRHALTLNGLSTDTKYYYTILSGNVALASEYFNTAKDSTQQQFSFIQYGDCGYNNTAQHTIGALMEADEAEFAVVCGDVDQGGVPHVSQGSGGDNYDDIFFNVYNDGVNAKMLSRECHYPAIGNHDTYADNTATYQLEFHLPHNNADSTERYYSFTWGDAKFIALDVITPFDPTTFPINQLPIEQRWWTDFRPGSPQYVFLEDELKCNDKKWVFIYFHEGPWTNYWGADYNIPNFLGGDYYQYEGNVMVRQHLVPLFEQYGVDFVMVGHSHLYEQAEKNGVMYITSGGAGDVGGNTMYANNSEILKSLIDNLYVKYTVDGNTVSYDVINDDNLVIDTFTRTKTYTTYSVTPTITHATCFGASNGAATLNVQGPKPPYTVEWFDGSIGNTKTGLSAGTYYAYVKNAYGCEKVTSITITEPAPLTPQIVSLQGNFVFCEGDSVELSADNIYNTYSWSNGATSSTNFVNQAGLVGLTVTDVNGCVGVASNVSVSTINNPIANFGYANNDSLFSFLCPDASGSQYYWNFGDGMVANSSANTINHIYAVNGQFTINLIIENQCDSATFSSVIVVNSYNDTTAIKDFYLENALSVIPNPFNDFTEISVQGMGSKLHFQLYNALGELVLSENMNESKFNLERGALAAGTYFLKVYNTKGQFSYANVVVN